MKKTYIQPHLNVVAINVSKNLMLVVTSSEVDGNQALAPALDDLNW